MTIVTILVTFIVCATMAYCRRFARYTSQLRELDRKFFAMAKFSMLSPLSENDRKYLDFLIENFDNKDVPEAMLYALCKSTSTPRGNNLQRPTNPQVREAMMYWIFSHGFRNGTLGSIIESSMIGGQMEPHKQDRIVQAIGKKMAYCQL